MMEGFVHKNEKFSSRLTDLDRTAIAQVFSDTAQLLQAPEGVDPQTSIPADSAVARLLPTVSIDPVIADEYRRFTQDDLRTNKRDRLMRFADRLKIATVDTRSMSLGEHVVFELSDQECDDFLGALTDIRLVIADRLGIETDEDSDRLIGLVFKGAEAPLGAMAAMYAALGWWQETLVESMLRALPEASH